MAGGEFLQLLASLERQKKAEVDADMKLALATNLETRREEARAHETALARKHQANMYLLNSALQDQRALEKEVKVLETGLEGLGISIQEQSQLKAEVVRERKANMIANGLGNPHNLFVRF